MQENPNTDEILENLKTVIKNRPVVNGYTIDGPTSLDLDDGLFLREKDGKYILEISIADVASIVKLNSKIFQAAYESLETDYYATYNIPMLPKILSEDKLSLMPGYLRPALTFFLEFTEEGTVSHLEIKETAFHNIRKLSYDEFDSILKHKDRPLHNLFNKCYNLAKFLYENRRRNGALAVYDLRNGIYTNEEGAILPLGKASYSSHLVIQEFAIITNKTVATFFAEMDIPFLFRNHTVKQNAPARDEILSQIDSSVSHPELLPSFFKRFPIWFNRADYGPKLRGHFALNEPVYTHITSPIRRIADLLNHYIIKSYIHNEKSPLSFEDLSEISEDINKRLLDKKLKKQQYYKEKTEENSLRILQNISAAKLDKLDDGDFVNVIRAAIQNNLLNKKLEISIEKMLKSDTPNIVVLYLILFKTAKDNNVWQKMKESILKFVSEKSGFAVQLLHILEQKEHIKSLAFETKQMNSYFNTTIIANFQSKGLIANNPIPAANKKASMHDAALAMLEQITGISLPKKEITPQIATFQNKTTKSAPGGAPVNFVGKLMEICAKNNKLSVPYFEYKVEGLSHAPIITCYASINSKDIHIQKEATANNKKDAKQEAAEKLYLSLKEQGLDKIQKEHEENTGNGMNYIGELMEFCRKYQLPQPKYFFKKLGEKRMGGASFECTVKIKIYEDSQEFLAYAGRKKQSKQNASKLCLDYLRANYEEE
jgi:ribonuclease R